MDDICKQSAKIAEEAKEAATELSRESVQAVGKLLESAFQQIKENKSDAVSDKVMLALQHMKDTGLPIAKHIMKEIEQKLGECIKYLSDLDVQQLYDNIGKAAAANLEGFIEFWENMQDFMDSAIEEGRELAKTSLPVLINVAGAVYEVLDDVILDSGEILENIGQKGKDAASVIIDDIYDSTELQKVVGDAFEDIEDAYTQSRESIHAAMTALAGISISGCTASCPLLQFEIVRDFAQTISLFFTNFYIDVTSSPFLRNVKALFGSIANFIAIDIMAFAKSEKAENIGLIILLVIIVISYIVYLWFIFHAKNLHSRDNEVREGHEAKSWSKVAATQQRTVQFATYAITICVSIYLPITRLCLELLSSHKDSYLVETFSSMSESQQELMIGQILSAFILLTFVIPLPIILFRIIQKNKPAGTPENPDITHDIDGEEIPFNDKIYKQFIEQDPNQQKCPYRSLYQGFERRWAYYKVIQLVFKLVLLLPLILMANAVYQAWASFFIFGTFAGISFYTTPFIDPKNDVMDSSGRTVSLITCFGGVLLVSLSVTGILGHAIGLIINIANGINFIVMGGTFLLNNKLLKTKFKNAKGIFYFSDTVQNIAGKAEKIIPLWDLDREIKHRIWHTFWEGFLLNKCGNEVAERLMELKELTANSGIDHIRAHWNGQANSNVASMRLSCQQNLEGVDVYWNYAHGCRDGKLDSNTFFGKLYIHPYPFHCVLVYDDAKVETFIRDDKFEEFFKLNMSHKVIQKRHVRQKLRALDKWAGEINLPFNRIERERVRDGSKTETYKDGEGNSQTREVPNYSNVSFTCYYKYGHIIVRAESSKIMAAGFNVSMKYADGHGMATLPNTGETHHFNNRCATMGHEHIGLHDNMEETSTLRSIFSQTKNSIDNYLPQLISEHQAYRNKMIQSHLDANKILGDGFWYYVFNNATLSRQALTSYLQNQEGNDIMRSISENETPALNFLYRRIQYINLHPAIKLWYVFWDDFYYQNKDMKIVQRNDDDFNPLKATSICYKVLKRKDLEKWLEKRYMTGHISSLLNTLLLKKILFNDKNMDILYQRIYDLQNPDSVAVKV